MKKPGFPPFLMSLPSADMPLEGLTTSLLQGEEGQVLLLEATREVPLPMHSHCDQWGFIVDGDVEFTIGDETRTYRRGDSYFIPAGTMHGAIIREGAQIVDFFADRTRYRPRPRDRAR